jgi:hypothetical protein
MPAVHPAARHRSGRVAVWQRVAAEFAAREIELNMIHVRTKDSFAWLYANEIDLLCAGFASVTGANDIPGDCEFLRWRREGLVLLTNLVLAENLIRAGKAACRYSWRVTVTVSKKSQASRAPAWERRKLAQVVEVRSGAGSIPACCSISHTVEGATLIPSTSSSPWIRR